MRPLKSLTFEAIVDLLATTFREVEDSRAADQLAYSLHDTLMSGFALLFFQHPSLLRFQRAMKQKRRRCNLETIFGVHEVPSDTQMREILDGVDPEVLRAVLPQWWEKVRRAGWGGRFTTTLPTGQQQGTYYTVALDGSEHFHSTKIQCPHCLRQPDAKGQVAGPQTDVAPSGRPCAAACSSGRAPWVWAEAVPARHSPQCLRHNRALARRCLLRGPHSIHACVTSLSGSALRGVDCESKLVASGMGRTPRRRKQRNSHGIRTRRGVLRTRPRASQYRRMRRQRWSVGKTQGEPRVQYAPVLPLATDRTAGQPASCALEAYLLGEDL